MNLFALKDSLVNFVTGLGTSKDPTANAQFQFNLLDRNVLENMYRSDWIARKVVDAPAEDATREWRSWHASQKQITAIQALEKKHDLQRKMRQAIVRGRLYGGAALVLGVEQGESFEELDPTKVGKDDLKFVVVLNRYELMAGPRIYNVDSPWYTRPEYYTVATPMFGFSFEGGTTYPMGSTNVIPYPKNGGGDKARQMIPYTGMVQIHPSRVIEFIGNELPDWRLIPMGGNWGDSILQTIEETIRDIGLMTGGMANMVNDAKMDVIKIPGFTKNITTEEYSQRLLKRFMIANSSKSSINSILLDADEEWNRIQTSFGGLPDLLREFFTVVAGAADIPVSKLVGASPGKGLAAQGSSGGEQDEKGYYDRVASKQETVYRPAMEPLDEVLIRAATGARDPNIEYIWNPLWQMSEDEKAKVDAQKAATTQIYVNLGIINEDALRESVVNQLIEDQVYPGIEDAIEEFGAEPSVPDAPFGYDPATGEPASAQGLLQQHSKLMKANPGGIKEQIAGPTQEKSLQDYDPEESRAPKGSEGGGRWIKGGANPSSSKSKSEGGSEAKPSSSPFAPKNSKQQAQAEEPKSIDIKIPTTKSEANEQKGILDKTFDTAKNLVNTETKIALWGVGLYAAYKFYNSDLAAELFPSEFDKVHSTAVEDIAKSIASEQGFDPSKITMSNASGITDEGKQLAAHINWEHPDNAAIGKFLNRGDEEIIIYHKNLDPTDTKQITGVMSHEIMHSVYDKATKSQNVQDFMNGHINELIKGGKDISEYSKWHWEKALENPSKHQDMAINETLAEIARRHMTEGSVPGNPAWKQLYNLVRTSAKAAK